MATNATPAPPRAPPPRVTIPDRDPLAVHDVLAFGDDAADILRLLAAFDGTPRLAATPRTPRVIVVVTPRSASRPATPRSASVVLVGRKRRRADSPPATPKAPAAPAPPAPAPPPFDPNPRPAKRRRDNPRIGSTTAADLIAMARRAFATGANKDADGDVLSKHAGLKMAPALRDLVRHFGPYLHAFDDAARLAFLDLCALTGVDNADGGLPRGGPFARDPAYGVAFRAALNLLIVNGLDNNRVLRSFGVARLRPPAKLRPPGRSAARARACATLVRVNLLWGMDAKVAASGYDGDPADAPAPLFVPFYG